MSAQPAVEVNRPDFEQSEAFVGSLQDDPARHEVRHLFSAFLDIYDKSQLGIGGFEWIRQGVFREVRNFTYSVPNPRDIERAFNKRTMESPSLSRAPWQRSAADVAEGWMRTNADIGGSISEGGAPTGLVLLNDLQALDSHRPDHRRFLEVLNEILWPVNYETADEHKALLRNVDLNRIWHEFPQDLVHGRPLMERVERTVTQLLDDAIPRAEAYCRRLYRDLADEFKGLVAGGETAKGARREAGPEVQRACRWLAVPTPVKPATALDAIYATGAPGAPDSGVHGAMTLIAQQVEQQGKVLELMATRMVNGDPGTTDLLASFSDIMRSNQALMEKLVAKETADKVEAAEEVAPKASSKGPSSKRAR